MSSPKDKLKFELNPITGELDLISEFNADKIITSSLLPNGNPRTAYDPVTGLYFQEEDSLVMDENGNVVTI